MLFNLSLNVFKGSLLKTTMIIGSMFYKIKKLLIRIIDFNKKFNKDIFYLLKYIFSKFNSDFNLKLFYNLEDFDQRSHLNFCKLR